jgi:lysyl-tRNA synthetase class II
MVALGTTQVIHDGEVLELAPPWRRVTLRDAIIEHAGVDVHPSMPVEAVRILCDKFEVPYEQSWGSGKLMLEIYEKTTEHKLVGPVFVLDYPREVSPLARVHRDDSTLTERFEAIIGGRELANAFSELNDPVDQRERFEAQAQLQADGDAEAHGVDEDYLRAIEYGLPPTGGLGIGIDRLVMLIAGVASIREVILFPQSRPERPEVIRALAVEEAESDIESSPTN